MIFEELGLAILYTRIIRIQEGFEDSEGIKYVKKLVPNFLSLDTDTGSVMGLWPADLEPHPDSPIWTLYTVLFHSTSFKIPFAHVMKGKANKEQ